MPIGPHASAQRVGRVAQLSRNVRQPNHVIGDSIAGYTVERRPGAGEVWIAPAKYDGADVESILIDKTKAGQEMRQVWSGNVDLPIEPGFSPRTTASTSSAISVALGPTDFSERETTHFGYFRQTAAKSRSSASQSGRSSSQ